MKIKKYTVMGGWPYFYKYGESDTIRGAKIIAAKAIPTEGHRPPIYLTKDIGNGDNPIAIYRDRHGWIDPAAYAFGEIITVPEKG